MIVEPKQEPGKQMMDEHHDPREVTRREPQLRVEPYVVDNPLTAVVIAFVAGALAASRMPGRSLIFRAARMLLMKELELAVAAAL
jgi:hypothetical protein